MENTKKGTLQVLISTVAFGSMGVFAAGVYRTGFSVGATLFYRFFFAAICMGLYMALRGHSFQVTKTQFKYLLLLGLVGYALFSYLYFTAIKYTGAAITALVFSVYPVHICVIKKIFFKEPIGLKKGLCLGVSLVALVLLTDITGQANVFGIGLAVVGSFFYAIYTILIEHREIRRIPPVTSSFYIILLTAVGLFLTLLTGGIPEFPQNFAVLWRILCLGIISTCVAILTFYLGVQNLGSVKASIISNFEALVATCLSMIFLGETLTFRQWVGAVLMIASVIAITILKDPAKA